MLEKWTQLFVSMENDASIEVSFDAHYEWDGDEEVLVYEDHEDVSETDIFIAICNSGIDCIEPLYGDDYNDGYEFAFVALCNSPIANGFHGYFVDYRDAERLNDELCIVIRPLVGRDDDVKEAVKRYDNVDEEVEHYDAAA